MTQEERQAKINNITEMTSENLIHILEIRARMNPVIDEDLELVRQELLRRLGA